MKRKNAWKWLAAGLFCFLFLAWSTRASAGPKQSGQLYLAPPLSSNQDTTIQSMTLLDPADVRLCGAGCTGSPGTTTIITSDALPTLSFQLTNGGKNTGEAYLAILVPAGNSPPAFTVNGNTATGLTSSTYSSGALTGFLAVNVSNLSLASGAGANIDFNAFASASAQVASTPGSFTVYVYDLGPFSGTTLSIAFGNISGFPPGTIFWGFLTNQSCTSGPCVLTDTTPLSEAVTVAPEPGTLALAGTGLLLLLAGTWRRRWSEK